MLLIVISAWLAVLVFGVIMCRLGARSDDAHSVAVAEWIATRHFEPEASSDDGNSERVPSDAWHWPYRATG